jgi:hypothetical protein
LRALTAFTISLLLLAGASTRAVAAGANCSLAQQTAGLCQVTGTLGDGNATLEGTTGSSGSPGSGAGASGGPAAPVDPNADCIYLLNDRCLAAGPGRTGPVQPITLADIAQFRPDPGIDRMEPDGWMVVGLDTNFFASSAVQVHNGTLLGQTASVRFTPVTWHWTYGDGGARSSGTAGAPWAALGAREFDATATSHRYLAPGTYVIDLTIDFTAEYRFGTGPWLDIPGILAVPANRLIATAGSAKTVLVERECTANPAGPGC